MQLKRLTLQAFGPFKDKVVIDFEQNKLDKGLLLISGDTGAGKTTIFDAICYALYGQTSGETRTANSLRSDWASSDIDTFVELEFYYKNKLYEVKRSPEYSRMKKSGTGETKQSPTAMLNINGRVVNKTTDVTREIETLIGLDYKQFRQVAMLSQGEFTKFLLASSEDKTTIFRKIFSTEFYDQLQNKLRSNKMLKEEEIKKIRYKIDIERKKLESIINIYGCNDEETIKTLKKKIEDDTSTVLSTKKLRDKKNDEKTKLTNEIANVTALNKKIAEYNTSKTELDALLLANKDIKEEKEKYDYNINIAYNVTSILSQKEKDATSLKDKKEKSESDKKELNKKLEEYKSKEAKFNSLSDYSKNVDKLSNKINELLNELKNYDDYLNKKVELENVEKSYTKISAEYEKQHNLYENMRTKYYLNIAVEIADTLVEGEACPVCGSTNHPTKASPINCEYTKEDLDKAEKELNKNNDLRKSYEAKIEETKNTLKKFNIDNKIDVNIQKDKTNILLEEKKKEKADLEQEFKMLNKEKEQLTSNIKSLEDNIKIFNSDIQTLEKNIKEYSSKLAKIYEENNTSYEDYLTKKLDQHSLNKLKEKIDNYNKKKHELESKIEVLEPDAKGKEVLDITKQEKQLSIVTEEHKKYDDEYTSLNTSLEKLKDSTSNIEKYIEENKTVGNEYATVKILSDTANGLLTGKQKITFENYVQSYFMNTVLIEANKRLIKMTDSRYELKRKEGEIKLNTKTGLEFSIFDSYTGKERDVESLSGGEKFKASLALALGLSDTISNNCGGIKIDSLFIDEGFGSLDSESLNQALNILSDLSGNDKLVGVISHVSELMSRIDNKIIVNKTNTGSVVKIEGNH